ncbi:alanine/glycine:cation symporter family protein [Gephyromycinifex aptenodytis]|uniref:alanine/glycine:cation symporter family protein n=1 Tax=Gephyromycinifex aptenodytis TaxID=2716227 RepID=UPI0014466BD1|nr:alanine/glycine:cation symporter family protein [Gephyromycinifex aptenodytis]
MNDLHLLVLRVNGFLTEFGLVPLLVIAGVVFTVWSRGMQFRMGGTMLRVVMGSRSGHGEGISSFQAFAISLASRVGTGNIAGVAIALAVGGPGAIFWMWVMAMLGMATAFIEATLAQLYKQPHTDSSFRGGPAYYIERGLGSRAAGIVFAVCLIFTFGFAFNMVQANTIADVLKSGHGVPTSITATVLVIVTAAIVLGGIKSVARVTEYLAPLMALAYFLLALAVIVVRLPEVPGAFADIFQGAFGLNPALAGTGGAMFAAVMNGVKRGMFSNEAGMGSAPNAAATATVSHPAHQGLVQATGVFVDTMIVCTATAIMILLAGPEVYRPGVTTKEEAGASLTQTALASELGTWVIPVMTVLIFVFAFSSVLGNSTYAEINMDFLHGGRTGELGIRVLVVVAVLIGSLSKLAFVWDVADFAMSLMAIINLIALLALGRYAIAALRDLERTKDHPEDAVFELQDLPTMPKGLVEGVWDGHRDRTTQL